MRINEILTESEIHQLSEGPKLDAFGAKVGQIAGGVAKGVGAVAGGVAGLGKAFKKGYAGGKATVAGDPNPNDAAQPAAAAGEVQPAASPAAGGSAAASEPSSGAVAGAAKPAAGAAGGQFAPAGGAGGQIAPAGGAGGAAAPTTTAINKAGPAGAAPATAQTGAAGAALAKTTNTMADQTATKAGQTMYAQVKANVDKLDKKGKQRILQLLQKSVAAPEPKAAPAAGAGAMGQMAKQLGAAPNTMANAPVSKTNTAKPGNPNAAAPAAPAAEPAAAPAAPKGNYDGNTGEPISDKGKADAASMAAYNASPKGKAQQAKWDAEDAAKAGQAPAAAEKPGFLKTATDKIQDKNKSKRPAKPSQAEIDADREARMGPTSDSIIRTGNRLQETFQAKVKIHKARMVAEGLKSGTISIFRK
jgi:hypothetical protein